MKNNIEKLKQDFQEIKNKGWIKSVSNSTGAIGTTFEKLLDIKENCSSLPDYYGIEIKCSTYNSTSPITLFSLNFDGPSSFETKRLADEYGHPDKIFSKINIIYSSLSCKNDYLVNNKYYFKLEIDKINKKIFLVISDFNHNIIEKKCYITFQNLKEHLYTKFKHIAFISGLKKNVNGQNYFKYYKLTIFELTNFETFINLIERDLIKISLISRVNKSNLHYGKVSYKNVIFSIKKYYLHYLFTEIN